MIVELGVSSLWAVDSFQLQRGGGIGDGHRIRMEDREDKGCASSAPGSQRMEGWHLPLRVILALPIDRVL